MQNGRVRLGVGGTGMSLPMPPITLTDLGTKEGGITPDQLVFAVMKNVTGSVGSATASAAGDIGKTGAAHLDRVAARRQAHHERGILASRREVERSGREKHRLQRRRLSAVALLVVARDGE